MLFPFPSFHPPVNLDSTFAKFITPMFLPVKSNQEVPERALTSPASEDHAVSRLSLTNYDSLHPEIRVGYKLTHRPKAREGHIVIPRFTLWATVPQFVRASILFLLTA